MNHYSTWKKFRVEDKAEGQPLVIKNSSTQPPSNIDEMKYQDLLSLMSEKGLIKKSPSRKKKDLIKTAKKFWE